MPKLDSMKGRFAQMLPPKAPDEQTRLLAQTMLKVKGVKTAMGYTTILKMQLQVTQTRPYSAMLVWSFPKND
jgi:hypothetical protein